MERAFHLEYDGFDDVRRSWEEKAAKRYADMLFIWRRTLKSKPDLNPLPSIMRLGRDGKLIENAQIIKLFRLGIPLIDVEEETKLKPPI